MLIWKLWIRRWKEFLTLRFYHIFSRWKQRVLFSSSESCCVFQKSFPFVQSCWFPVQCHSAPSCGSVQRVCIAWTAIKNSYSKTLRIKAKQHYELHYELEIKINWFLSHASSVVIQRLSGPVLCKFITRELCLLCHLDNPISFFGVIHITGSIIWRWV